MIIDVNVTNPKRVEKQWGYELWIHNEADYCGKLLVFSDINAHFSMHYHIKKKETWYVQNGSFTFHWIDVENGNRNSTQLKVGDVVEIERGLPHQLIALESNSIIFEVSTEHFEDDSYRIYRHSYTDLISTKIIN
jgi:mannose-6-phosphate isomerase-like protein (cupin superfamily)